MKERPRETRKFMFGMEFLTLLEIKIKLRNWGQAKLWNKIEEKDIYPKKIMSKCPKCFFFNCGTGK